MNPQNYRNSPQKQWSFEELIIDSFAGGGGASTGIEQAAGRSVDIAINHDPAAISMHTVNHPQTKHYCESVWDVDPVEATNGNPVGLAWFSPDCRHHSKAKGGKPVEKKVRGLAWIVLKWAAKVQPRIICLENVEEFADWGPLTRTNRPNKFKKGETFEKWKQQLKALGYKVEHRTLRACDYGAPTTRKRLFLIARRDDQPIVWPTPTHGKKGSGLKPYKTAASIIDWSIPCPSIFTRKKPLAENTLKRIARGLDKFVINNPKPFFVPAGNVAPFIARIGQAGWSGSGQQYSPEQPLTTVTTKAEHLLVEAFLVKHFGGNYSGKGVSINSPIDTVTTVDHHSIVSSHLVKLRGTNTGSKTDDPVPTITAGGTHIGEIRAFLLKYYGSEKDGCTLKDPLHTITTKEHFGLVMVKGTAYQIVDIGMRMLQPHELFAAQGFPSDYVFTHDATGKAFTKKQQVAKCGNSVCPPLAAAVVAANYTCISEQRKTA